jgi:ribosomal protein S18 acetylase RimI-like enzyme
MTDALIRTATPDDAEAVARLHADSWRRHYRGAYSDAFLDGDVLSDRLAVWEARLAAPGGSLTLLAEDDGGPVAFVHAVFDEDPLWGSLIDNLHVTPARQRSGAGRALMERAAEAVAENAAGRGLYLWVLQQNDAAQAFYRAMGGEIGEEAKVSPPNGVTGRLVGEPVKLRVAWPDAAGVRRRR